MAENNLVDSIQERLNYYKAQIIELKVKNVALARIAVEYALELDSLKPRNPTDYAEWHHVDKEDWL